jgi:hypothetical protein
MFYREHTFESHACSRPKFESADDPALWFETVPGVGSGRRDWGAAEASRAGPCHVFALISGREAGRVGRRIREVGRYGGGCL